MAMRSTLGMIGALFPLLALLGCAQVVGIEEFSVGQATGGGGDGGGATVDPCNAVHGCTRATAKDETGVPVVYITFSPTAYNPRCILIDDGATVTFKGSLATFVDIPLTGGVSPDPDLMSPLKNPDDPTSPQASFVLSGACSFPFFSKSNSHTGVIFVN